MGNGAPCYEEGKRKDKKKKEKQTNEEKKSDIEQKTQSYDETSEKEIEKENKISEKPEKIEKKPTSNTCITPHPNPTNGDNENLAEKKNENKENTIQKDSSFADPEDLRVIINSQTDRVTELEKENEVLKNFIRVIFPNFNQQNLNTIMNCYTFNKSNKQSTINFFLPTGSSFPITVNNSTRLSDVFTQLKKTCKDIKDINKVNFLYDGNIITNRFKGKDTVDNLLSNNNSASIVIVYN